MTAGTNTARIVALEVEHARVRTRLTRIETLVWVLLVATLPGLAAVAL